MPTAPSTTSPGVSTGTIASSRIVVAMDEELVQLDPIRRPMLFMLGMLGLEEEGGPVTQWHEEDRAQIMTGTTEAADFSGFADGATVTIGVDDASVFQIHDEVYAWNNTGDALDFRARVTAVDETNDDISLELVTDGTNLPGNTIANNTDLYFIGSAFEEFASRAIPTGVQPTVEYNYIQKHKKTWSGSDYMMSTDVYGEPEFQRLANRNTLRNMQGMENSLWWGIRRVNSPVGGATHEGRRSNATQPRWMSGGIEYFISTNALVSTGNLGAYTYTDWVDDMQILGEYNPGAVFFGFLGPDFVSRLNAPAFLVGATNGPVNHNREMLDEAFGFKVKRLESTHGDMVIIPSYESLHNRSALAGGGTDSLDIKGFILYMRNMRLVTLKGHSLGELQVAIQNPGDDGQIDGTRGYLGLKMKAELHSGELLFDSNT